MPLARIIARADEDALVMSKELQGRGYDVEIYAPDEPREGVADLELVVESCTPEEALRRASDFGGDVYVAPGVFAVGDVPPEVVEQEEHQSFEAIRAEEERLALEEARQRAAAEAERRRQEQFVLRRREEERRRVEAEEATVLELLRRQQAEDALRRQREEALRREREEAVRREEALRALREEALRREREREDSLRREREEALRLQAEEQARAEAARLAAEAESRRQVEIGRAAEAQGAAQQTGPSGVDTQAEARAHAAHEAARQYARRVDPLYARALSRARKVAARPKRPPTRREREWQVAALFAIAMVAVMAFAWTATANRKPANPVPFQRHTVQQEVPFGAATASAPAAAQSGQNVARPAVRKQQPAAQPNASAKPNAGSAGRVAQSSGAPKAKSRAAQRMRERPEDGDEDVAEDVVIRHFGKPQPQSAQKKEPTGLKRISDLD